MPAMGDLFAPAFQRGNAASEQAVSDWQNRVFNVTPSNIEQTRAPVAFNTGHAGGMLDPEALRVLAQGGPYDFNARRNAIAAATAAQPAAQAQQSQLPTSVPMQGGGSMPIYGRAGAPDAYLQSPEGQYWIQEMNRIAQNGAPTVQQPVYQDSYGGGP